MEDKKLLTKEELEKVAGGSDTLGKNVRTAFRCAEIDLERIKDDRADVTYRNNVYRMLDCCRQALDGSISAEAALGCMQDCCNQIKIEYRLRPQDILDNLRDFLSREY